MVEHDFGQITTFLYLSMFLYVNIQKQNSYPLPGKKNAARKSVWLWICWGGSDFWKQELIHPTIEGDNVDQVLQLIFHICIKERLCSLNSCLCLPLKPHFLGGNDWTNIVPVKIPPICCKARTVSRPQECIEVTKCRHDFNIEPSPNCLLLKGQKKMCVNTMKGGLFMCHPHTSNHELWLILLIIH